MHHELDTSFCNKDEALSLPKKVHELKNPHLPAIDHEKLSQFQSRADYGSIEAYASWPEKIPAVSQQEFAKAYVLAADKIISIADEILQTNLDKQELKAKLDEINIIQLPPSLNLPNRSEWLNLRDSYEANARQTILELAEAKLDNTELNYRALQLAIVVRGIEEAEENLVEQLQGDGLVKLQKYSEYMVTAREYAGENATASQVLNEYCELVSKNEGYIPDLIVYNDFDGNLTKVPESGSKWKPGEHTNSLVNQIDTLLGLPRYLRLVLTESQGLDPEKHKIAQKLFLVAADQSEFYSDVSRLFKKLHEEGKEHHIITGNHISLVRTKLLQTGLDCTSVVGVSSENWYDSKVDVLLAEMLRRDKIAAFFFSDDNDQIIAQHLSLAVDGLTENLNLADLMFLASRKDNGHPCCVADALNEKGVPHVINRATTSIGTGLHGTLEFTRSHSLLAYKQRTEKLEIRIPEDYAIGDVVRACRTQIALGYTPQAKIVTVIRPVQDETIPNNFQYDLGVPTAALISGTNDWLILYKAAERPSGSVSIDIPSKSNVFAAKWSNDEVRFLCREGEFDSTIGVRPIFESALNEVLSRDGLHDPRITYVPELDKYLILACAFNKKEEQQSIAEARGDITKPIRGAVTELIVTDNLLDVNSYKSLGVFGPDHHFKNMVFFPEMITIDGEKHLLVLTRKMPGIQAIPIPLSALDPEQWAQQRVNFWERNLALANINSLQVINPYLPYEGQNNPHAPMGVGQVAPGLPPIAVEHNGQKYWLVVYNAVPDFSYEKYGSAYGRVISCALLEHDKPWNLIARSPVPIIAPRPAAVFEEDESLHARHADVAFCGGGGVDSDQNLCIFYTEMDTNINVAKFHVPALMEFMVQFDSMGNKIA